jgi:isoleucyl-tRNA synthetase
MFKKVDPKLNLPLAETEVLEFWQKEEIFKKSLEKEAPKGTYVFYEGPPTANGQPGIHHVLARSFKDLFARYRTMQGYYVKRKAGWDTHGLPVELQVEKALGISGKGQIENIIPGDKKASVEKFNQLCKESVWKYKGEWEKLTERMGYWVDMSDPYITYDSKYIESIWWIISELDKKGLLYKGHKVVPYCPRCGTALSTHEVAQGYEKVREESIYVKIKSTKDNVNFLVWTTTPWTLAGNAALAFGPKISYVLAEKDEAKYILAKQRADLLFGDYIVIEELSGAEIVKKYAMDTSMDYEPLYPDGEDFAEAGDKSYKLITADYVSDSDGTGIVHIAPAFGADDYTYGFQKNGIKVLKTVDDKGTELAGAGKGSFVKDADQEVKLDLEKRGILFKKEMFEHDYPFCWRCSSPLLYFARDSWYIAMSKLRDQLLKNNDGIKWNPSHLQKGRFGNWLENIADWSLSRDRYWGTPLPVWTCDKCDQYKVVSSLDEVGNVEPHKPYIDEVTFDCQCGGKMTRTPEVMDVWFDSGAMPFAQYHQPFENEELFQSQYPAKFICEAIDQTRGWFYTLLAISTALRGDTSFESVISTGHVLDARGKKMSKSKGNIVVPNEAFEKYGADVVRMFFYSVNQPGEPKLFIEKEVLSLSRNLFLTLWNVYSFFMTYATIDKWEPRSLEIPKSDNVLDKWIFAKLQELINETNQALDNLDPYKPSNQIIDFVGELSTWYVRRSRRRFWKSENDGDKNAAYDTLYYVLCTLSKILAPFTPMFAETLYQGLKSDQMPQSVHLTSFPESRENDKAVLESMKKTREIVETGLSKRAEAKIKIRQPLQSLSYTGGLDQALEEIIAEEVNVKAVIAGSKETSLDTNITEQLKLEGLSRELIRNIQALRKNSGFEVEDRITLCYQTDSASIQKMFTAFKDLIAKEVLANAIEPSKCEAEGSSDVELDSEKIWIGISRN